jgi:hypothetical protein
MDTHKECCSSVDNSISSNICDVDRECLSDIIDEIKILYRQKIDKLKVENIHIREDFVILQETSSNKYAELENKYKELQNKYKVMSKYLEEYTETQTIFKHKVADLISYFEKK